MDMIRYLLRERRAFLLFIADISMLTGVAYFGWDAQRIICFFCFDVCLCILSFVIYNIILEGYSMIPSALTASIIAVVPAYFIAKELLVPPYYDFTVFTTFALMAHAADVRKYLSYQPHVAKPGFALYVGLLFLMAPFLYLLIKLLNSAAIPQALTLLIPFFLVRHFSEYKRYAKFREIEKEDAAWREMEAKVKSTAGN